eukprot:COSAG02_NODE_5516_length_4266_cov_11.146148_6_plen_133_part_00
MDSAEELVAKAAELLPEKDVPVICFCAVGGRAGVAKSALEAAGYSNTINAGGLSDIEELADSLTAEGRLAALGIELPELVPVGRYVPYVRLHSIRSPLTPYTDRQTSIFAEFGGMWFMVVDTELCRCCPCSV